MTTPKSATLNDVPASILDDFFPAYDLKNVRWAICKHCGTVDTCDHFVSYGGFDPKGFGVNFGTCKDCARQF